MQAEPSPARSVPVATAPDDPPRSRWAGWWRGRSSLGLVLAVAAFLASFAPSLLPRSWLFQGAAAGLSAATSYAVGAFIAFLLRPLITFLGVRLVIEPRRRGLVGGVVALVILGVVGWTVYQQRQSRVLTAKLVQMPAPTVLDDLLALLGGIALTVGLVVLVVLVRIAFSGSRLMLQIALRPWVASVVALVLVVGAIGYVSNEFLVRRSLESISAAARTLNESTPDLKEPTSSLRSGGPGSAQSWSELGYQGRSFTGQGPTASDIETVTGRPAMEPIRVYGGLEPDMSLDDVANTVVGELERTGAFDRSTLTVIGTTGSGWVDEHSVAALEYLTGGDSATAAMQYSYLPSPIAFLTSRAAPAEAGRLLFEKVYDHVQALPVSKRPRLYASGESLGAFGGTAAFHDVADLEAKVDGAVWIGTPSFTPLWRAINAERLRGSPQVTPVFDQGRHVRFLTRPAGLDHDAYGREYGPWQRPRVAFLQHASDPIVWWSPSLLGQQPDWIREGVGPDVNPRMQWWPLVTFWQVTLDMVVANEPPAGHGHVYHDDLVPVWDAVLHDQRSSPAELGRIVAALRASHIDRGEG